MSDAQSSGKRTGALHAEGTVVAVGTLPTPPTLTPFQGMLISNCQPLHLFV